MLLHKTSEIYCWGCSLMLYTIVSALQATNFTGQNMLCLHRLQKLLPVRYKDVPQACYTHCYVSFGNERISFCLHLSFLQAFKKSNICFQHLSLIMCIITHIMAITAIVQPINWFLVPKKTTSVLPTWPIWPTIVTITRKQLWKKCSGTSMPW